MKAIITLDEDAPAKIEVIKDESSRTLHLSLVELAKYIVSVSQIEEHEIKSEPELLIASPSLPPNTIKYGKLSDDTDLIFLYYPETSVNITYHQDTFKNVPFPNLVFCFAVKNEKLVRKYVYAYRQRFLRDDTHLYRFPFSNVFDNGSLCYYDSFSIYDLVQLQTFAHNWLHQPFNDHLYNQGVNNSLNKPLREIFEQSQNKPFDYSMLVSANMHFQQWTDKLLKTKESVV